MSAYFRVFPWLSDARPGEPGHPLYVSPRQGAGRVDNPEHYLTLYASDAPAGAVAEAFGNHAIWTDQLLEGPPGLPGSRRALAAVTAPTEILDLDDPTALLERGLRPSQIVTRELAISQAWALGIYREGRWGGVRWWSRHDAAWSAAGIWDRGGIEVDTVEELSADHSVLVEAAEALGRPWR